ncbi:MAG: NADH:ubiquinone oxidoreductase subunit J [Oceanicaulis sp.]|uniref:NADH-quinone oxidoreductase subunit J n=1 Tax=Maricaulis virginensis TaxID=144022 RepID=A0A9W6IL71_9PROT|nr:NADH-quinone oxidoreductase subunit J [Maricaulis virginensis]MBI74355.1 NADH:ubiquinone oxidoreductase subunit J [Oceanicaulis sp.]GLK52381.1 NADH:ubiquinone oxidoreductase subunit J [Maricaulis virginensis]
MLASLAFWAFSGVAILSALMVVIARNPVRSVLFLILAFISAAGLFVLLGAEFLAMLLIVVYVGAVAVLFLFVVMMLDVDFAELKQGFLSYLPLGGLIAVVLAIELAMIGMSWESAPQAEALRAAAMPDGMSNVEALGTVIYDQYVYFFQIAGLVLLVAMIGAIVLTLRHKEGVKRQSVTAQVGRDRKTAVEMLDIKPGQGIGE